MPGCSPAWLPSSPHAMRHDLISPELLVRNQEHALNCVGILVIWIKEYTLIKPYIYMYI